MPRRTSYRHGTPNWVELQTPNQEAAKSFYGRLFGWEFEDRPMPQGPTYSMAVKNGGIVAGIASQAPDRAARDVPPRWNTHFAVDDVDASAARVEVAGGRLLTAPFDVADAGRMAFAADPTGVSVGLWQAGKHIGATVVNEPGTFIWSELMTADHDAALPFYEQVLGLTTTTVDLGGSPFTGFTVGEDMIGGIIPPQREGVEHRWIVYFSVAGVEEIARRVEELGGTVVHGPISTPVGPLAALRDPQGGAFSVWAFNGPTK
ncbi:VOC family protein [Planomonospora sp. ID67723]|uniref:VOC family protein n=1 Tax=Planomonospora sp. ID67723 TaxID=2738134 RepID=UPI0018C44BE1|nr:VOC family protein [Planomonospora sp. ID67723]MBG0831526.1 VOC family protein [Planomonospora sp. ID67723]